MPSDPAGRVRNCPFCGGEAGSHPDEIGSGGQHVTPYHVGCRRCRMVFSEEEEADAIAAWNTRAADTEIERLRAALTEVHAAGYEAAKRDAIDRCLAEKMPNRTGDDRTHNVAVNLCILAIRALEPTSTETNGE